MVTIRISEKTHYELKVMAVLQKCTIAEAVEKLLKDAKAREVKK